MIRNLVLTGLVAALATSGAYGHNGQPGDEHSAHIKLTKTEFHIWTWGDCIDLQVNSEETNTVASIVSSEEWPGMLSGDEDTSIGYPVWGEDYRLWGDWLPDDLKEVYGSSWTGGPGWNGEFNPDELSYYADLDGRVQVQLKSTDQSVTMTLPYSAFRDCIMGSSIKMFYSYTEHDKKPVEKVTWLFREPPQP